MLQEIALRDYVSVRKMAKKFGSYVQYRATQERSLVVSKVKDVFFQNHSPFALVTNVLLTDLNKKKGDMQVNQDLVQSGVTSVDAVRKLLKSKNMYRNPVMYNLFCSGIESGKIKYNPKKCPTTISKLLTISHEASIRSELWWALTSQSFRHLPTTTHIEERVEAYKKFRDYVIADRADNEEEAAKGRHGDHPAENDESGEDDDDEDELDPKYY